MKKQLIFLLLLCCVGFSQAQEQSRRLPITIGYFSQIVVQPGIKLGTELPLNVGLNVADRQWLLSPQAGFFSNPGDDRNLVLNLEAGLRKKHSSKNHYNTYGLGLGYLRQAKVVSFAVNLGSGNTSDTERDSRGFFMPTLSHEWGWATHKKRSWYTKLSTGYRLFGPEENSLMLFAEIGIKLNWNTQKQED